MEQMTIDESMRVPIDYTRNDLPTAVKELKPVVFKDGDSYCTLLGPDPQQGIFGCALTVEGSLEDWQRDLRVRTAIVGDRDEILQEIKAKMLALGISQW